MVFALVGDSTMTTAPFPTPAAVAFGARARFFGFAGSATSVACGASASSFTLRFLAATHQSFVKRHESASLPSRTRLRKPDDLIRNLRRRLMLRFDLRVRVAIERLALLLEQAHARHRILS